MKSKLSIILSFFIFSIAYAAGDIIANKNESPQHQHTFLVKTDLTKEQVETLLNLYHQSQNKSQVETTTLKHKNSGELKTELYANEVKPEKTQLKAKKEKTEVENSTETSSYKKKGKKEKSKKQEVPEIPESPETENATETTSLKKKDKKEKSKKQEVSKTPEVPEKQETENNTETVSLKKKGKKGKNNKKEASKAPGIPEVKEVENKTSLLANETSVEEDDDSETEIEGETESEIDTIILTKKNIPKQNDSKTFGFFFTILLTIAFVSLIIYATQPMKSQKHFRDNNNELNDYLLLKEN